MNKLLKDKFEIKVSETTVRKAFQEHEYHCIASKIYLKYLKITEKS